VNAQETREHMRDAKIWTRYDTTVGYENVVYVVYEEG
jgi:hypothetical protein